MFEKILAYREHIPPHRVWSFLTGEIELSLPEAVHMINCEDCRQIFDACMKGETFGEALGIWLAERGGGRAKGIAS